MDDELGKTLIKELRDGFGMLAGRIDQTNEKLDQHTVRLDRLDARVDETNSRIDETNTRLDQVITRLDRTSLGVDSLRAEVNQKLDGVGACLRSINGHILDHAEKIARLDKRLNDFETGKGN